MSLNNASTPSDAVPESVVVTAERHRRWLRSIFWIGGLLVLVMLLMVIGYQLAVTRTLRQHGWELENSPDWLPDWVPEPVATRIAPFSSASLFDQPQPQEGDFELLRQYSQLESLDFRSTELSESSLAAISRIKTLVYFNMISTTIDEEGLRHLNLLPEFNQSSIQLMTLGDVAMKHLANCPNLQHLYFWKCHMDDDSWAHFSTHSTLGTVSFTDTDVGNRAMEHLSSCPGLWAVTLNGTRVTDDGIVSLAKCPKLKYLIVAKMPINNAAIQRFLTIRSDVQFGLSSTNVTQDAVDEVKRKYPGLDIDLIK